MPFERKVNAARGQERRGDGATRIITIPLPCRSTSRGRQGAQAELPLRNGWSVGRCARSHGPARARAILMTSCTSSLLPGARTLGRADDASLKVRCSLRKMACTRAQVSRALLRDRAILRGEGAPGRREVCAPRGARSLPQTVRAQGRRRVASPEGRPIRREGPRRSRGEGSRRGAPT